MKSPSDPLCLAFGFQFAELYENAALARLDAAFLTRLGATDPALAARLATARAQPDALDRKAESELLLAVGPHLEDFLGQLFGIEAEMEALTARHHALAPLYSVKRQFVQRKAMNTYKAEAAASFNGAALRAELERALGQPFEEAAFARAVGVWQADEGAHAGILDTALRYCARACPCSSTCTAAGVRFSANSIPSSSALATSSWFRV